MTVTYYAVARNPQGKLQQLLVTREDGRHKSQEWTPKIYKTMREATADLFSLNAQLGRNSN
jgi:hypothetical protein